ncbi:MAG: DUF86 domain-containing protein [Mariniphaga sp.]|nr:DUF86 domain-containing protein [Mariniphaga sp.]
MRFNGIIEKKLRIIEENIDAIKSWKIENFQQFKDSSLLQKATERALQVSIEVMIDISERILALNKLTPTNTSVENIQKLEELDVIQSANEFTDMIRFRNFIVHRYEKVDVEIVYSIIKNKLNLFEKFVEEIRSHNLP